MLSYILALIIFNMEAKVRVIELEEKAQYLIVCHAHITEERFPMSPVSVNSINLFLPLFLSHPEINNIISKMNNLEKNH